MTHHTRRRSTAALLVALVLAVTAVGTADARGTRPDRNADDLLPIVFVHGQSGSAQQFETQAMRFTSNGYPQRLLFAYDYDTSVRTNDLERLDAFIDDVLEETGAEQVNAIGHSRGTGYWAAYLSDAELGGAEKVARYVNIDGYAGPEPGGVPSFGIWGEWNTAGSGFSRRDENAVIGDPGSNAYFADKGHTEVAAAAEPFAAMYEFLTGTAPRTTEVLPELGRVTIAGRAVLFPQNVGYEGTEVQLWKVRAATGQRIGSTPKATAAIDESGEWGPFGVSPHHRYELTIVRPDDQPTQHYYFEPFTRSDHFVRLNSSRPGEGVAAALPTSDGSTNLNVIRQRELWGDQGEGSDELTIDGTQVLTEGTSPRTAVNLALFAVDADLDGVTDIERGVLPPFGTIPFLTAVDVAIEASPEADGAVPVSLAARGGEHTATITIPNRPSTEGTATVQFRDDERRFERVADVLRAKLRHLLDR